MRRTGLALAALVACVPAARSRADESGAREAFVEVTAPRTTWFVGEPIRLRLRVGFDAARFRDHAIQRFRRELDVPVHVVPPWEPALPGTAPLPPSASANGTRLTLAVGDDVVAARRAGDEARDGRTLAVVEVERAFLAERPGPVAVPAPTMRWAETSEFRDDLVQGRVPTDRRERVVAGAALALDVRPLPAEGRPARFGGAIGTFALSASADRGDAAVGETIRVTLRIEGEGNVDRLDPPRLDDLAGFHVVGSLDDRRPSARTVVYELAPLGADVAAVPPIELPYFDPSPPGAYRVARTAPIPLRVRPAEGGPQRPDPETEAAARSTPWWLLVGVPACVVAGIVLALRRRGSAPTPTDRGAARVRAAADAFRSATGTADSDVADAFATFLASRLGCAPAAVIGPDLRRRLETAGVAPDLAARAATLLERLVAARYGGDPFPGAADAAAQIVEEMSSAASGPTPGP